MSPVLSSQAGAGALKGGCGGGVGGAGVGGTMGPPLVPHFTEMPPAPATYRTEIIKVAKFWNKKYEIIIFFIIFFVMSVFRRYFLRVDHLLFEVNILNIFKKKLIMNRRNCVISLQLYFNSIFYESNIDGSYSNMVSLTHIMLK